MKLLEDNLEDNLGCGDYLLDKTPKIQFMKEIIDRQDIIKIKTTALQNPIQENEKSSHKNWDKIFAKDIYDKGLLPKI